MPGIAESWRVFRAHVKPRRLIKEDPGVKGPLWFGRRPDSALHIPANLLRLSFAIILAPIYIFIPHTDRSIGDLVRRILWGIEWAKTPDAILLESPGSLIRQEGQVRVASSGEYAVTGNRPKWLLKVVFRGTEVVSWTQVKYERECGYTAISYAMDSAENIFFEAGGNIDDQPEIKPGGRRKYSLRNRQKISEILLHEYARARRTIRGAEDGIEYIWLDEFCLSDPTVEDEEEIKRQRNIELGNLADIFRGAKHVAVFCHVENCDHTDIGCPWGSRLFTMGEILHAPEVLQMTRSRDSHFQRLDSRITVVSGQRFRADMQARAEEAKKWHLCNIMQYATNSGAVTWQSAIHSLVVEAIRRDEAGGFCEHNFLGKALNGLLPRRSQLDDLRGENGWADLAWLLELNQGYYNAALLAAVCELADPKVEEYRWWGKPIVPREGSERLEALVTAIPVKLRQSDDQPAEPVLSIIGPKSVNLLHWLQRDSAGLYRHVEMRSLMRWALWTYFILFVIACVSMVLTPIAGGVFIWVISVAFVILELLVGTIFVEKDTWVVIEDHIAPGRDAYKWLQSQDPTFNNASEWGSRQLVPRWDPSHPKGSSSARSPYPVTLIDLGTGTLAKAVVTSRPNNMVILAVHGSGITCMLLDRDEEEIGATVAEKVGMVNLPPFVLAQAEDSGTVYVGRPSKKQNSSPGILDMLEASLGVTDVSVGNYDIEKLGV